MKKLTILIAILITTMSFAQVPNYVPTNGLVGWWPFNGNANDESGNGNNGTVNGATLTVDRNGVANQAYSFDGIDDFIQTPNQNLSGSVSFSGWYKMSNFNTPNNDMFYVSNQSPTNDIYSTNICFGFRSYQGQYGHSTYLSSPLTGYYPTNNLPTTNVWHHIACVVENNSFVKMYLDNVLIYSNTNVITNSSQLSLPLLFGGTGTTSFYYYLGQLDDIGIWNIALTECEIQDLYHSQLGFTTIDAGPNQTICKGDSVTLNGSGGIFLSWNNGVIDAFPFAPLQTDSYVLTGADILGCVGTDTVNITVLNPTTSTQTQTALDTYTWPINNQTYTQGGTYTATIPNAAGCDSVVTLNLTLNYTGINEPNSNLVSISPNPTSSIITVKASLALIGKEFTIYDQQGKAVKSGVITAEETEIDLSNISEGIYLFKAGEVMHETFKIIKQ